MNRITSENITRLEDNEIFCFGSNLAGVHGAGAARTALRWGAKYDEGVGLHGQTYALPTKDIYIQTMSVLAIKPYVEQFINFAKTRSDLKFLVTEIGCGLAGHAPEEIAPLFRNAVDVENIYLPERFWNILNEE